MRTVGEHMGRTATRRARGVVSGLVLVLTAVVLAPPAQAQGSGTIVFIRDANVWIMAADDPASARAVTTDGTADAPYIAPTQDDEGTIYAVTSDGYGQIVTLSQDGAQLAPPFRPQVQQKIDDLDLSPDGRVLAITSYQSNSTSIGAIFTFFMDFVHVDGSGSDGLSRNVDGSYGSFYTDDDVVLAPYADSPYEIAGLTTHRVGTSGQDPWFDTCRKADDIFGPDGAFPDGCAIVSEPQIDRSLSRMAALGFDPIAETGELIVYALSGPPPTQPSRECSLPLPDGSASFDRPDWSPDGDALVWGYGGSPSAPAGIYVATGVAGGCQAALDAAQLVAPGGSWPDWSPAPLGASPSVPDPFDPSTPTPGGPGAPLVDGARLDGGGTTDPVAQAVATSQALFADGRADRVVLATADRFPDALAGTALAGDDGPILLTAGLGDLDPRVEAEIARVTGGHGTVLVLGGTSAVSDRAAAQAIAAAGNRTCAAPLPTSCRYAGSGREETAALIAGTVIAEAPDGVAFIARGDDFADAITGGALAAATRVPILLTPPDSLAPPTAAFLTEHDIELAIVLGGPAAVDEATYAALPVPQRRRVAGDERTGTAAAIATQLWDSAQIGHGGIVLVNVRAADGWQTALTAAVASAVHDAPQLGVENPPAGLSAPTRQVLAGVEGPIMAFGGPDLVSDAQLEEATAARG